MKEFFENRRLHGPIKLLLEPGRYWEDDKDVVAENMREIIERYQRAGDILTLRQLYYQLVAADLIPNHDKVYKKIGGIKDDMAYSGMIDWDAIEDRNRKPWLPWWTSGISEAVDTITDQYRLDRQEGQETHIEVWTEKDAISGILRKVTSKYHVKLCVNRGYTSSSAIYGAYERFGEVMSDTEEGRKVCILYFGDHDPSGLDMVRDIEKRLRFMLVNGEQWGFHEEDVQDRFEIRQIGLSMEQIQEYNLPHNPAKISDPRAAWYIKQFGKKSWEVDALKPEQIREIVTSHLMVEIDEEKFDAMIEREQEDKKTLRKFSKKFNS